MGWWFGRKSVEPARSFPPVWLHGESESGGFARGIEGMWVLDRNTGQMIVQRNGVWETGVFRAKEGLINGQAVLRNRQPAIADPAGGT